MLRFQYLSQEQFPEYAREMFAILAENMSQIAPTDNSYEEDFACWREATCAAVKESGTQIILFLDAETVIGYLQYRMQDNALYLEEIELRPAYQGKQQIFRQAHQFLIAQIPNEICFVNAVARKENLKSNGILMHLGLHCVGENRSGSSNRYRGTMENLKLWLLSGA